MYCWYNNKLSCETVEQVLAVARREVNVVDPPDPSLG